MSRTIAPSPVLSNPRNGLTNEEIASRFPAVFADQAHESRSSRYLHIPSHEILNGLRDQLGYVPTTVMHQRARVDRPGLVSHGKHLIRFSHLNDLHISQGERHEVVMINSGNGDSSFQFLSGLFTLICTNGCVFGDVDSSLKVRHMGSDNLLHEIMQATYQIAANSVNIMEEIERFKHIILSWDEQIWLAEAAMAVRFDKVTVVEADPEQGENEPAYQIDRSLVPFQPEDFLRAQRPEDYVIGAQSRYTAGKRSLQKTYQVMEENFIERPVRSSTRSTLSHRRSSTRSLHGIDGNVKMQGALWYLTKQMAELRG